jgi:hypothetical protein
VSKAELVTEKRFESVNDVGSAAGVRADTGHRCGVRR